MFYTIESNGGYWAGVKQSARRRAPSPFSLFRWDAETFQDFDMALAYAEIAMTYTPAEVVIIGRELASDSGEVCKRWPAESAATGNRE